MRRLQGDSAPSHFPCGSASFRRTSKSPPSRVHHWSITDRRQMMVLRVHGVEFDNLRIVPVHLHRSTRSRTIRGDGLRPRMPRPDMRSGPEPAAASAVTPITGQCGLRGRSPHPDNLRSRSSSRSVDNRLRGGVACCRPFPTRWPWKPSATSNAAHQPDGHRRVGVDRNPPVGTMDIPSIARKLSSNVATNSAPCRRAAAEIAASAKLNRAALRMRNSRNAAGKRSEQGRKPSSSASSRISATSSAARCPRLASTTVTTSRNTYSINRSRPNSPRRRDSMADAAAG